VPILWLVAKASAGGFTLVLASGYDCIQTMLFNKLMKMTCVPSRLAEDAVLIHAAAVTHMELRAHTQRLIDNSFDQSDDCVEHSR
jgi:hypothetical protein